MSVDVWKIPTVPGMGRSIVDHDPRNRNFPTRGVLHATDQPLVEKAWRGHWAYNQGSTSQCVAYSGKGMLNRLPFSDHAPWYKRWLYSTDKFYDGAQAFDEWPGSDYDGTSGRGMLRYWRSIEMIREFRWCFGVDDVLQTLSAWGPVSIGTWWKQDMFSPDPNNDFLVTYTGESVGGHQWTLTGIDPHNEQVEAINSWGRNWGNNGRFRVSFETLDALLKDQGDAYTLVTV